MRLRSSQLASMFATLMIICSASLMTSCSGLPKREESTALNGMVYDTDNRPVSDAEVLVNDDPWVRTDVNGRFALISLPFGHYSVTLRKTGFEQVSLVVDYADPTQIIYAKMISADQLVTAAAAEVEHRRWSEALALLDRAEKIGPNEPLAGFIRSIVFFRQGKAAEASDVLKGLIDAGFREPHLYLFLSDIYQYSLDDTQQARLFLREYLNMRYDPDAERRLEEMEPDEEDGE